MIMTSRRMSEQNVQIITKRNEARVRKQNVRGDWRF